MSHFSDPIRSDGLCPWVLSIPAALSKCLHWCTINKALRWCPPSDPPPSPKIYYTIMTFTSTEAFIWPDCTSGSAYLCNGGGWNGVFWRKKFKPIFFLLSLKWMQKRQLYQRGVSILKICHRWLCWYVKPRESCECDNCVSFANRLNMLLVVWVTEMGSTRSSWHTFTVVAFIFHLRKYCSLFSLTIH